jgi:hypothetical protein
MPTKTPHADSKSTPLCTTSVPTAKLPDAVATAKFSATSTTFTPIEYQAQRSGFAVVSGSEVVFMPAAFPFGYCEEASGGKPRRDRNDQRTAILMGKQIAGQEARSSRDGGSTGPVVRGARSRDSLSGHNAKLSPAWSPNGWDSGPNLGR